MIMYRPVDIAELRESGAWELRKQYEEKFGERFPRFNVYDFPDEDDCTGVQLYVSLIKKALETGVPYRIEKSKVPYEFFKD